MNLKEFYHGRLFLEAFECDAKVSNNVLTSVSCKERSTYKIGARGDKGTQANVFSTLTFVKKEAIAVSAPSSNNKNNNNYK